MNGKVSSVCSTVIAIALHFQPSIEVYAGEDFFGVGPGFIGLHRFSAKRQLKWEAGFISELSQSGRDHSFRLALEFEF